MGLAILKGFLDGASVTYRFTLFINFVAILANMIAESFDHEKIHENDLHLEILDAQTVGHRGHDALYEPLLVFHEAHGVPEMICRRRLPRGLIHIHEFILWQGSIPSCGRGGWSIAIRFSPKRKGWHPASGYHYPVDPAESQAPELV